MYNNNNICIYWWTNTHICSCLCLSKSKSEYKSWLKMNHLMIITICRAEALNKDRNIKRSILSQQVFQISLLKNWFLKNFFSKVVCTQYANQCVFDEFNNLLSQLLVHWRESCFESSKIVFHIYQNIAKWNIRFFKYYVKFYTLITIWYQFWYTFIFCNIIENLISILSHLKN